MPLVTSSSMVSPVNILKGGGGISIPYSIDFTALADGALPSVWLGSTWSISGSKAINIPVGVELLTNGSFTNWTAGVPDGWGKRSNFGASSLTEDPSGQVRYQSTGDAMELYHTLPVPGKNWFASSIECTSIASGEMDFNINTILINMARFTTSGTKTNAFGTTIPVGAEVKIRVRTLSVDANLDNASLKALPDVFSLLPSTQANVSAKVAGTVTSTSWAGVVCRADTRENPQNYLLAIWRGIAAASYLHVYKVVNGVMTSLYTAGVGSTTLYDIEMRCNGTAIEVWSGLHGGTQYLKYSGTVNEPTINDNTYHGMFSLTGGNSLDSFFLLDAVPFETVFMGGSNTTGSPSTWYWGNILNNNYINEEVTSNIVNAGYGGAGSWYGLFRYMDDVVAHAPDVLFIEFAVNDVANWQSGSRANLWKPAQEAFIRKLRAALPDTRIIFANLVLPDSAYIPDSNYKLSKDLWAALCTKYDIEMGSIDTYLQALLGKPDPTAAECAPYGDGVHFTTDGHQAIADMFAPNIPSWYPHTSADWTGVITDYDPPYFADLADWMYDPIKRNGIDNDGETGSGWSTSGTARLSSTPDDTISWTGTFSSCGLDHNWTGVIKWSIDGGVETQVNLEAGLPGVIMLTNFDRDVHTVTIKVVSGTVQLNRFLAV